LGEVQVTLGEDIRLVKQQAGAVLLLIALLSPNLISAVYVDSGYWRELAKLICF
jgi:hypothetical protein